MNRKERSVCVVLSLTGRNALLCLPHSDVLISVQMDRPVHQNSSDKPTDLLHVRQLCPLKRESEGQPVRERVTDLVCVGIVALHTAEYRLVLTKSSSYIDPPLVSHHSTAKPSHEFI